MVYFHLTKPYKRDRQLQDSSHRVMLSNILVGAREIAFGTVNWMYIQRGRADKQSMESIVQSSDKSLAGFNGEN